MMKIVLVFLILVSPFIQYKYLLSDCSTSLPWSHNDYICLTLDIVWEENGLLVGIHELA